MGVKVKRLLILLLLFSSQNLFAITLLEVSIEQLLLDSMHDETSKEALKKTADNLQLDKITIAWDISRDPMSFKINLSSIQLPEPFTKINSLKLSCQEFTFDTHSLQAPVLACHKGQISAHKLFPVSENLTSSFSFSYNLLSHDFNLDIDDLMPGKNSSINLKFKLNANQWTIKADVIKVNYRQIKHYLDFYFPALMSSINDLSGQISFTSIVSGIIEADNKLSLQSADIKGIIESLNYSFKDDLAENLGFDFDLKLKTINASSNKSRRNSKTLTVSIIKPRGVIYQNEIFIEFSGQEKIKSKLVYNKNSHRLNIQSLDVLLPDILHIQSSGELNLLAEYQFNHFKADIKVSSFEQLNHLYLHNILEGSDYEGLEISGQSTHSIDLVSNNNSQAIEIKSLINNLTFNFKDKVSFKNLNGDLFWDNKLSNDSNYIVDKFSRLSWESAALNNLPLGRSIIHFITTNDNFKLTQSTSIPIFDGALQIDNLEISHIGQSIESNNELKSQMTLLFDGLIKPISLKHIAEHFNWPLLDGQLSAIIPATHYNEDRFEIGGAMMLQVFDGFVIIKNLKIENPLQDYARLEANIDINNVNLQSLTKTYDFGEIQGRLEGKISNLVLDSWQPIAFNSYLQTPKNDNSRHRISQRAIDNLSSLGGASGLLSRSFLSLFKTFGYDKIGLSCHLKNNICTMSGVEAKGNGYYIVKGGGIPRIDVMGFQDKVNWQVLMSRLSTIQSANQAVIE